MTFVKFLSLRAAWFEDVFIIKLLNWDTLKAKWWVFSFPFSIN